MAVQLPESPIFPPSSPVLTSGAEVEHETSRFARIDLQVWVPALILILIAGACFFWPLIDRQLPSPIVGSLSSANLAPLSRGHLFGTDPYGDDIFSRILYGGRVSLEVGFGASGIGLAVGGAFGMLAGFRGGVIEMVIMRLFDILLAFPSLVLALVVAEYLGPSELHVIWAISFFSVPAFARLSRSATLHVREQEFVAAARLSGTSNSRILRRHIAPHVVPQLLTFSLLGVAVAIMVEATLSYLGLGVPPPGPSWGNMINLGEPYLGPDPWLVFIPCFFLLVTVICVNLLGDAFRLQTANR